MASLVSAGVQVTVTDESFYIPAGASTVPLIFLATADEKKQPDGVTNAAGTYEYNVIRQITSVKQSTTLYGIPRFLEDSSGNPLHGDCRNEYGLFALNQALGVLSSAYVVRANVNLNDEITSVRASWDNKMQAAAYVLENLVSAFLTDYNSSHGYTSSNPSYKTSVSKSTLLSLTTPATATVWQSFSFKNSNSSFTTDATSSPLLVYANGYDAPSSGSYVGLTGLVNAWTAGTVVSTEFTPTEASSLLIGAADDFKYTLQFQTQTSLGSNDAARRTSIVTALAASINSNTDLRSESYEYNLILCPGYHEVVDELIALNVDIGEEAFVIADTPMDKTPETVVTWAATSAHRTSTSCAYYYPHGYASNLDGKNVFIAASGIALRTYAYSDNASDVWFAPAGLRRGLVSGVDMVGYVSGTLGTATTFTEVALNKGQRDSMYNYFVNINPIVFFPGRGIVVWGQKTSASAASSMDRVNVSRLVGYVRRQLRKNSMSFVFEPNDQLTRDNLQAAANSFLSGILVRRGLYDYATLCDESNNTPDRIQSNQLYLDIALKPVIAAEFVYIPIRVVATGASI
jgi:hypothetical protein